MAEENSHWMLLQLIQMEDKIKESHFQKQT
jgi:hypothetical protein